MGQSIFSDRPLTGGGIENSMIWKDVYYEDTNSLNNIETCFITTDTAPSSPTNTESKISIGDSISNKNAIVNIDEEFENNIESINSLNKSSHMPSPINGPYHDSFRSDDDYKIDVIPSITDDELLDKVSGTISELPKGSIVKQKGRKKRKRHEQQWVDVKRKYLTNHGKKYITKRGKIVGEKVMGEACNCRYKCFEKITQEQRMECFVRFWNLGNREKQWSYVLKCTRKVKKNRSKDPEIPNHRQFTFKYSLPIYSSDSNVIKYTNVCKTMFLNTFAVGERIVRTAYVKKDNGIYLDKRGKHDNHKKIVNSNKEKSVCDHVNTFIPITSDNVRQNSNKMYLDDSLSIECMYNLYKEWFDVKKYGCNPVTKRQYREIVSKNFNLGFEIARRSLR